VQLLDLGVALPGGGARRAHGLDPVPGFDAFLKHGEAARRGQGADVDPLQAIAEVGLVGAVFLQRIVVGEAREGPGDQLTVGDLLDNAGHQLFDQGHDVFALDKAHLQVKLGELRLAVAALILVAEAAGDLEVALVAGHHQELLELLGTLGQGIELAGMHATGHQVVARAFRRGLEQDRRLDFHEAFAIQEVADVLDHAVAQDDVALHPLAAQIQVTVLEPQGFIQFIVAEDEEGRGLGRVENDDCARFDLDRAGIHGGILHPLRPGADGTCNLDDVFVA